MPANSGITADEIRFLTITDAQISLLAAILESKISFNIVTGHNHNGVNSRLISGGGSSARVIDATFTGAIDGFNATLTTPTDFVPNSVAVHVDGLRQKRGLHFNESGLNQIVFTSAIPAGSTIVIDYAE
jgi:hypothetical protein